MTQASTVEKSLPSIPGKSGPKPIIDVMYALKLRLESGLTYKQIAKQLGCSHQAIAKQLAKFKDLLDNPEAIRAYEANRPKLYSAAEMLILEKMVEPGVLKKATLGNYAYALDKMYQINRLEQGKSTSNVAYQDITQDLSAIDKEIQAIEGGASDD